MNRLFFGDNLEVLRESIPAESVDLVYLDPPFNSNRNYNVIFGRHSEARNGDAAQIQAFSDTWRWTHTTEEQYLAAVRGGLPSRAADALGAFRTLVGENDAMAYLVNMAPRLVELHRVLKPTGSLYLHCDPTMSHYLKILLDAIFGLESYGNEVIWAYTAPGNFKSWYPRRHDTILFYTRAPLRRKLHTFNADAIRVATTQHSQGRNPWDKGWDPGSQEATGKVPEDWWADITPVGRIRNEVLGYPTQKPVALLKRIISASSNPGDVVLDPFCGCGTTIDAAQRLGRQWIGIDVTYIAVDLIDKRLHHAYPGIAGSYEILGIPRDMGGARALFARSPFEFERWAVAQVGAEPNEKQVGDKGIDGTARFMLDGKGSIGRMLVSVKGGKVVSPTAVRDLDGTIRAQKAQMGVLITMEPPTRGVTDAANHGGTYTWPGNNRAYPRIQVVTVRDLLAGKRPDTPPLNLPYIQAAKAPSRWVQPAFGTSTEGD